jgi:hypothetical protein
MQLLQVTTIKGLGTDAAAAIRAESSAMDALLLEALADFDDPPPGVVKYPDRIATSVSSPTTMIGSLPIRTNGADVDAAGTQSNKYVAMLLAIFEQCYDPPADLTRVVFPSDHSAAVPVSTVPVATSVAIATGATANTADDGTRLPTFGQAVIQSHAGASSITAQSTQ